MSKDVKRKDRLTRRERQVARERARMRAEVVAHSEARVNAADEAQAFTGAMWRALGFRHWRRYP